MSDSHESGHCSSDGDAGEIERLKTHLKNSPEDARAWLRLAEHLTQASRFDEAERAVANATGAEPWRRAGRLAHVFLESGRFEQAAASFMRAHAEKPSTARLVLAAACLNQVGQFDRALPLAIEATDLEPDNDEAWMHRALAEVGLGMTDAETSLLNVLRIDPNHKHARQTLDRWRRNEDR